MTPNKRKRETVVDAKAVSTPPPPRTRRPRWANPANGAAAAVAAAVAAAAPWTVSPTRSRASSRSRPTRAVDNAEPESPAAAASSSSSKKKATSTVKETPPPRRGKRGALSREDDGDDGMALSLESPTAIVTESIRLSSKKKPKSAPNEEDASTPAAAAREPKSSSPKKKRSTPSKTTARAAAQVAETTPCDEVEAAAGGTRQAATKEEKNTSSERKSKQADGAATAPNEDGEPASVAAHTLSCKPAPTVDVTVHRLRHLNYHPKPVLCIASTECSDDNSNDNDNDSDDNDNIPQNSMMAVSRESGAVELQTINPKWRTLAVVAGSADTPLTALAWIGGGTTAEVVSPPPHRPRLAPPVLVGAHRTDLYVVDFWASSRLVAKTPCAGGGVFCLVAVGGAGVVAAGCHDGSIRIFRVIREGHTYQLLAVSTVASAGSAILSLACRRGTDSNATLAGAVLFAGVADGTIRRYDCHAGPGRHQPAAAAATNFFASAGVLWKATLRMTVECDGRSTPTRVWALKAAADGTVVSGDSLGHVQFWDGDAGTLVCSFEQNDSRADVLALDITADETRVFASGVDSRVVCIERSLADGADGRQWIMTHAQRPHTHDVKAVSVVKKFQRGPNGRVSKETEILFTGGIDTKLCTYHVSEFGLRRPRALFPWPTLKSPIVAANKGRILTMLREDRVDLYKLAPIPLEPTKMVAPAIVPEATALIGTVLVKGLSNLACSAVSNGGDFLAISDSYVLLLFHLQTETDADGTRSVAPIKIPVSKVPGAASIVAIRFVGDLCLVVATSDNRVHLLLLALSADGLSANVDGKSEYQATFAQSLSPTAKPTEDQASFLPVHAVIGSKDGSWFATLRNNSSNNSDGMIDVYRRKADTDCLYQFWWSLPSLGMAVTAAAFLENDTNCELAVACVNFAPYVFDVSQRCLGDWSEQAGYPVSPKLPSDLAARNDYPVRIGTNPAAPAVVMMGSFGAIVVINTAEEFPLQCRLFPETHVRGMKRKRSQSISDQKSGDGDHTAEKRSTCTTCLRYNSMLHMDFVDDNEMVVVEQPWLNVVATFPDALQRKVYGA